ncbi:MAG: DRTGG domain-containing protein [Bacillota bacterium]|nr:DRTGG domain-containing protein [Bacillota bacterium]
MTVKELLDIPGFRLCAGEPGLGNEIHGIYIGDLLSRVISRAKHRGIWITIMTNVNVAAVAQLADVSCVVLAEDVVPDPPLVERCNNEGIPLIRSEFDACSIARLIPEL